MRKFFILLVSLMWLQISFSQMLDSLEVFYIPFNTSTRYGYWENNLTENKSPKIFLSDIPSSKSKVAKKE